MNQRPAPREPRLRRPQASFGWSAGAHRVPRLFPRFGAMPRGARFPLDRKGPEEKRPPQGLLRVPSVRGGGDRCLAHPQPSSWDKKRVWGTESAWGMDCSWPNPQRPWGCLAQRSSAGRGSWSSIWWLGDSPGCGVDSYNGKLTFFQKKEKKRTTPKVNPQVNCGLWVIMRCHRRATSISISCNRCPV